MEDDEETCTICFERKAFVQTPCACTLNYCACCWDRALAASVTTRGRAQCPSCRTAFRVDYDPDAKSLIFSKETEVTTLAEWRSRLYMKAKPVQIRLLQDFGMACDSADVPNCVGPPSPAKGTNSPAGAGGEPVCVCGSMLERIDTRTRVVRMLEDTEPGWRNRVTDSERLVESLAKSSLITCDLCEEVATTTGFLWTCKNGPHTVLHPAAYDVCEGCFGRHVHSPPMAANINVTREQHFSSEESSTSPTGCASYAATLLRSVRRPRSAGSDSAQRLAERARRSMNSMVSSIRSGNGRSQ